MRSTSRALFLAAYAASGLAGLIYEMSWTRLLTLYLGHTTAATSAVVAAFMGGLAGGAMIGGRVAPRLTPRDCLRAYMVLEACVALAAILLPFELRAFTPILTWAYRDGSPSLLFPMIRVASCIGLMLLPAAALGATFPLAVRWYVRDSSSIGRSGGTLYAVNTTGAAIGSIGAGFFLIPTIGISGSTWVGVAASALAVAAVWSVWRATPSSPERSGREDSLADAPETRPPSSSTSRSRHLRQGRATRQVTVEPTANRTWLAAVVLGMSGFASLMFEIAWARVLGLTVGPTTYAFAATVAAVIAGIAVGSAIGSWIAGRSQRPAIWLALALSAATVAASTASTLAGGEVPRRVAEQVAAAPDTFIELLTRMGLLALLLILPTAAGLGAAFPLALATLGQSSSDPAMASGGVARRVGTVYAINTIAAVSGSLVAGFFTIPLLGLQETLRIVSVLLITASLIVVVWGELTDRSRVVAFIAAAAGVALFVWSPPWDRELLASGVYKYARYVPKDVDLESALKAGTLMYYKEGASSTVSVKRLTGTIALAIDGKVDASNGTDMLTQKLIAHLPLLLHENPHEICIIGVGSGVTLAAALRHPIAGVDVVELSPEVVEASQFFTAENHNALSDPRTHLIVGDGRSHLLLAKRRYDVIISEPSNPWIAGVAALFTREFFVAARNRLAPGGIICQWAHTYNISDHDLRSIVATFTSVFPNGTVWMVGQDDVLLVASADALDARLANIERSWSRPGVAEDLQTVGVVEPFGLWSLFAGGPKELGRYAAATALQTDDRMALEYSGPREMDSRGAAENAAQLLQLLRPEDGPSLVHDRLGRATAEQWRNRGAMMLKSDMHEVALEDYTRALTLDSNDTVALEGLVKTAIVGGHLPVALERVRALPGMKTVARWVAESKLLAAGGSREEAIDAARQASEIKPLQLEALDQLASLFAEAGDAEQLNVVITKLRELAPDRAMTSHYQAVAMFLKNDFNEAVRLAEHAIAIDPQYTAVYDVLGAARTKLGQPERAREAFETSLKFNARDTTAYTNLGLLELAAANTRVAANLFAEALWLDPDSKAARDGLAQAQGR